MQSAELSHALLLRLHPLALLISGLLEAHRKVKGSPKLAHGRRPFAQQIRYFSSVLDGKLVQLIGGSKRIVEALALSLSLCCRGLFAQPRHT
ncbi:MAG: hypothetical protein EBS54_02015 [Betaproteobacteria bacterium]|nr:hypothetical protein [Betaproteobacteria bacterium]